jgi:sec-independent protein translocase protein TatC
MSDAATELEKKAGDPEPESEHGKMSFLEHLDELRKRLVHIAAYLAIGLLVCWFFHVQIYNFLSAPLAKSLPAGQKLVYTAITDTFTVYMKVSFLAGIFLTIPFTLFEVWKFIAPGLYRKEKKYIVPFLVFSIFLFVAGGAFCYYIVLPATFKFLIELGSAWSPMITIGEYLDFINMMLLGFGLIFEMPIIASFLAIFGLVSASFLWRKFKYAIVGIVALAAVISPTGDAFNLMLWSAPMILLYIISIGAAAIFGWRRKKKRLARETDD